jgi:hypothetical protein
LKSQKLDRCFDRIPPDPHLTSACHEENLVSQVWGGQHLEHSYPHLHKGEVVCVIPFPKEYHSLSQCIGFRFYVKQRCEKLPNGTMRSNREHVGHYTHSCEVSQCQLIPKNEGGGSYTPEGSSGALSTLTPQRTLGGRDRVVTRGRFFLIYTLRKVLTVMLMRL